ncbi:hypothetical protein CFU_1179 [Collimonas fungivorans Ter331]|uniref:Uncharacterized protein n=1 Tax=Collimonas fungivorans (strain Ter331) TaxID=1005048 RepID=G0AJ77_COLFT|nr:hypothetical protein CFU_1179 [Collimonas fungivorans Ter331]
MALHLVRYLQRKTADRHAEADRQLLGDAGQAGGLAHLALVDLGVGDCVQAGELHGAHAAAQQQHEDDEDMRRIRFQHAKCRHRQRAKQGVIDQHAAEAEFFQHRGRHGLDENRAGCRSAGQQAGLERRQAETQLEQQRQQERQGAHADAEQRAAEDIHAQRRDLQQPQVDQRMRRAEGMPYIRQQADRADRHADQRDIAGHQVPAGAGQAEHQRRTADCRQQEADPVERHGIVAAQVFDIARRQVDAEDADRNIDEEDPAPVEIGSDETAQRRPDHRPQQGRDGQVAERAHQFRLGGGAQDHQPSDRHHHGAAHALQEAGRDKLRQRIRHAAQDRAEHEHADRAAEHGARAEAIRHPAADRDEHRQADQVGSHRQLQCDRAFSHVARHHWQRGGDHGGVHVFHEQGACHDQRGKEDAGDGHEGRRMGWVGTKAGPACLKEHNYSVLDYPLPFR